MLYTTYVYKAVGTNLGWGGAKPRKNFWITYLHYKRIQIVYYYICDSKYPLSYEPILAFLLYNDLYIVISILFNFLVG